SGRANLVKHSFDDVPVSAGQHLPENRAGNLDMQHLAVDMIQSRRLKPGTKGINAHARLHVFQKAIPDVIRHRHRKKKSSPRPISTDVKKLWKLALGKFCQASGITPAPERSTMPLFAPRAVVLGCWPSYRRCETARDCL